MIRQPLQPEEPLLEVHEIQGNAVPGFNKANMTMVVLDLGEAEDAREWVRGLADQVTDLATVMASRVRVRAARTLRPIGARIGAVPDQVDDVWVNVAFSRGGLAKLVARSEALSASLADFTDEAFALGMAARSALLGDPSDPGAEGHPSNWVVRDPDVLLIVAGDDPAKVAARVEALLAGAASHGLEALRTDAGFKYEATGKEHFGFQDGISQPGVRGRISDAEFLGHRTIEPHQKPDAWLYDLPGQLLVWPGEFVFGYPGASADPLVAGRVKRPGPSWSHNGSYAVYRRLRQDVAAFWGFMRDEALRLSAEPGFAGWDEHRLAANLVGRWRSGAPLMRTPEADDEALGLDREANNVFGYATEAGTLKLTDGTDTNTRWPNAKPDPVGLVCPLAAHIRKVHPREAPNDLGASRASLDRRLLRRGIPFGQPLLDPHGEDPHGGDRGLLFLSYQTSITDQFEFLCRAWMGSPVNPRSPSGFDMVVGQNGHPGQGRERTCTIFGSDLSPATLSTAKDFVIPTGGGYFFSPSRSALRFELGSP